MTVIDHPERSKASARGEMAASMVPVACELACTVRDEGRESVARLLAQVTPEPVPEQIAALLVVLAAMVPDDKSPADLLSWVTWDEFGQPLPDAPQRRSQGRQRTQPCGTAAAYRRHLKHREKPDEACKKAMRKVWARQNRTRRRSARERGNAAA